MDDLVLLGDEGNEGEFEHDKAVGALEASSVGSEPPTEGPVLDGWVGDDDGGPDVAWASPSSGSSSGVNSAAHLPFSFGGGVVCMIAGCGPGRNGSRGGSGTGGGGATGVSQPCQLPRCSIVSLDLG